jgi:hypothetical protein
VSPAAAAACCCLLPGPTNSGKTYTALQALAGAQRGVYCGPLRLLAMEVYETLNAAGVRCDMVTGQEVVRVPGAAHVSCTVEMASLYHHADVAVVDEIQVILVCMFVASWFHSDSLSAPALQQGLSTRGTFSR